MTSTRPTRLTDGQTTTGGAKEDAHASLRKLRNKVVRVTFSDPSDRAAVFAEFELSVSDDFVSALDSTLRSSSEQPSRVPNARLLAAIEESEHIVPRFKSAQELFDALEKEGQA